MKGFSEIRGRLFRISFDAASGGFLHVPAGNAFQSKPESVESVYAAQLDVQELDCTESQDMKPVREYLKRTA